MITNLNEIQHLHRQWAEKNFPDAQSWQALIGIMEELGELSHAHLKASQNIRTYEDHRAKKIDAVGDIFMYLLHYCELENISISHCVNVVWEEIVNRNWIKNPENGK